MSKTTEKNMDDRLCLVDDVKGPLQEALDALDNAGSCETPEDFDANMDDVLEGLKAAVAEAKAVRR